MCLIFIDLEPSTVSDWSFDENCIFCCLRRDKVKVKQKPSYLCLSNSVVLLKQACGEIQCDIDWNCAVQACVCCILTVLSFDRNT